jgi:RND superfamily putative drug exporter
VFNLGKLGQVVARRRRTILALTAIAVVVAGILGAGVQRHLSSAGFNDQSSSSERARQDLVTVFHTAQPNFVLLVTARHGSVNDPGVAAEGQALTRRLAAESGVGQVASYWSLGRPSALRSADGRQALVLASVAGSDDVAPKRTAPLVARYAHTDRLITVAAGGYPVAFQEVNDQVGADLARGEAIAVPLTLVLLVAVFGGLVAAGMPLVVGGAATVGTLLLLRLLTLFTPVSVFALNLTTALALGLGIDYSLFIVSRYREELRSGLEPEAAIVRTLATAGRTVAFSALTVAVSLSALLIFPLYALRSFAYAGVAVVVLAALGALVFLPALLLAVGPRLNRLSMRRRPARVGAPGFWYRSAKAVMARPLPVLAGVVALLVVLGLPFLGVHFGQPDDRVLPASASAHQVGDQLRAHFSTEEAYPITVVAPSSGDPGTHSGAVVRYAAELSALPGVARVDAATGSYTNGHPISPPGPTSARFVSPRGTWFSIVSGTEPISPAAEQLVRNIRHAPSPFPVEVGGQSAQLVDTQSAISSRIPLALAIIAVVTFTLLLLAFRSVIVPVKALLLNALSLTATFGALVWVFQEGHLSGLLGFTPTGTIDTSSPILLFCTAFGLSMDYEVFLMSRIKEEHDRGTDNVESVAVGLGRVGPIVTAAAGLITIVFLAVATSQVTFVKLLGLGLAIAVLVDATLVRGVLVPTFMRLAGDLNWWAPRPLRRRRRRAETGEPVLAQPHGPDVVDDLGPAEDDDALPQPAGARR